ncbi:hypothetical protein P153DRAFT_386811 [Dothidotthia symphoricarpi CBS 119687]|uniref:Uncharacterized protein n=1 Tax=Dothidotthia symphoricarpi CBS 119687 TaxID=1392245 RepID=A0A6A6ACR1_9PLEO|nr:uncharacterized protein P153DRAFT_386811 [Dothidotthia symphoricarpi CBS 119687]KAF2128698.1 hypothetical protein P153DRAFT_386811 [Dothidotthia symphoricarpi CBS 119687]
MSSSTENDGIVAEPVANANLVFVNDVTTTEADIDVEYKSEAAIPAEESDQVPEFEATPIGEGVELESPSKLTAPHVGDDTSLEDGEIGEVVHESIVIREDKPIARESELSEVKDGEITKPLTTVHPDSEKEDIEHLAIEQTEDLTQHQDVVNLPMDPTIDEDQTCVQDSERTDTTDSYPTSAIPDDTTAVDHQSAEVHTEINGDGGVASTEQSKSNAEANTPDCTVDDDEDTAVETPVHSESTRTMPPHLRPGFNASALHHAGPLGSKHPALPAENLRPFEPPRAPRFMQPYQANRADADREELARMSARLMKGRSELEIERRKNADLRKTIETEKQGEMDAALSMMLADLLHKQSEVIAAKAKVQQKERDLHFREQKIEQLEVFLSEGQKQLHYQLDKDGVRHMTDVEVERIQREAELAVKKRIADIEGKIADQINRLRMQESAQTLREQQYKAIIRTSLESEVREKVAPEIETQISQREYERGFAAGSTASPKVHETPVNERTMTAQDREISFLEGYAACHRTQLALSRMRNGRIPLDSPELDFLRDVDHPENLINRGMQLGRMEMQSARHSEQLTPILAQSVQSTQQQRQADEPVRRSLPPHLRAAVQQQSVPLARPANPPTQHQPPIRSAPPFPPPRTFASELRGPQTLCNGHVVLANRAASDPTPIPTPAAGPSIGRQGMGSAQGQGVYTGRRVLQYEEVDEEGESKGVDLIDLFG